MKSCGVKKKKISQAVPYEEQCGEDACWCWDLKGL